MKIPSLRFTLGARGGFGLVTLISFLLSDTIGGKTKGSLSRSSSGIAKVGTLIFPGKESGGNIDKLNSGAAPSIGTGVGTLRFVIRAEEFGSGIEIVILGSTEID